ncbi:C-X-C motif chemokine 11-1-like [Hypomesus transpacificus]|uniref:C-X-C motif chemokine 11-1-like n=1 Tax=Hypomesus transpacificus TaxID=137520 RepID=UPI001F079135|nr:C-X-C motif chemokine 11-1-like [Hypomesus transpacificus]
MTFSPKACGLLLVVLAAVCIQLYDAQFVPARCNCQGTIKFTAEIISDFQVFEKSPNCDHTEIIITLQEDNVKRCLNLQGKLAKAFLHCWNRINKDESQKMTCLNRRNKAK